MKTKHIILVLISAFMGLAVFFFWIRQPPSELTAEEREHYSKLLEKVYRQDDQQIKDVALESLSRRVTGLDIASPTPFWLGDAELDRRMCTLQLVLGELLSKKYYESYYEENRLVWILYALPTQTDKEEATAYEKTLTCGQVANAPYAKKSKEVLDWVKGWDTVPVEKLLEYMREVDDLKGDEDIKKLIKDIILQKAEERGSKQARYELTLRELNGKYKILGQSPLHQLASEGFLPAQMEIARRYYEGDVFYRNFAKSYYWYTQAKNNGGGREAQSILDTLRPQLSEFEQWEAERWKKSGKHPWE